MGNLAVASVLMWANRWIDAQLEDPMEKIQTLFGETVIDAVRNAALAVCFIIAGQVVVRLVLIFAVPSCLVSKPVIQEDEENDKDEKHNKPVVIEDDDNSNDTPQEEDED